MKPWNQKIQLRILFLGGILIVLFLLLAARLFAEQIRSSGEYNRRVVRQSVRKIRIPAQRGRIYTADRHILADLQPETNLMLYIAEIRSRSRAKTIEQIEQLAGELAIRLGRSETVSREQIRKHIIQTPGVPLLLFENLSSREMAIAAEKMMDTPGLALEVDSHRIYPEGKLAALLIGYTQNEDPGKADDRRGYSYYIADRIGVSGVEKAFDRLSEHPDSQLRGLRGFPGYSVVQVDNLGFVRKTIIDAIAPMHGNHVVLTIDYQAQKLAQSLLEGEKGAFVLLDADRGDVLAMVSSPGYDLSKFTPFLPAAYYRELTQNPDAPLFDRALNGLFSPGSILKPLVALAILESGVSPEETIVCDGSTAIGNAKINCASYSYGGHGTVNLYTALEKSCNDYFIEHGLKLGREKLYKMFESANLGNSPQLELSTRRGVLPTEAYKQQVYRSDWTPFDTGLISIGQGIITLSPLQAAMYTAAFANGGKILQPHILKEVVDQSGIPLFSSEIQVLSELAATPEHLEAVRQGMFQVVNAPYGSGRAARLPNLSIYGKTGTAEIGTKQNRKKNTWFIALLTHRNRNYAAALIVEDGSSGGSSCAPLIAAFFARYFDEE